MPRLILAELVQDARDFIHQYRLGNLEKRPDSAPEFLLAPVPDAVFTPVDLGDMADAAVLTRPTVARAGKVAGSDPDASHDNDARRNSGDDDDRHS